jgi:hypothetical protein
VVIIGVDGAKEREGKEKKKAADYICMFQTPPNSTKLHKKGAHGTVSPLITILVYGTRLSYLFC